MKSIDPTSAGDQRAVWPRLLVLDFTRIGAPNATGHQKRNLLRGWPEERLLQVWNPGGDEYLAIASSIGDPAGDEPATVEEGLAAIAEFGPDVIYYRPIIDQQQHLHALATRVLALDATPLVTHIVDDWPERLAAQDPARGADADRALREVFARSHRTLSISEKMSSVFAERYGVEFEPLANGVDVELWRRAAEAGRETKARREETVLRYCGALAKDMTFETVLAIARAVESLQGELQLRFEVYTMPVWRKTFERAAAGLRGVTVQGIVPDEDYPALLAEADILVLGYNFDADSLRYIGLSMPNKLPEYLASGGAVLAVGPDEANGIDYLVSNGLACCVTEHGQEPLVTALGRLADQGYRDKLASRSQAWAFEQLDLDAVAGRFQAILKEAAAEVALMGPFGRERRATVDEGGAIARLVDAAGRGGVMLDVGAHHGSSLAPFARAGWRVIACEPDSANRARLVERHGAREGVTIVPSAVSSEPAAEAAFFASEESTGISALHAFRETHREAGKVRVTTVEELVSEHSLERVDYLKIDVEGFDWDVLKGVPWGRISPEVIECEFEDRKTIPRGHTYREMADYLVERGYVVYLSEWHPIVRYGVRHQWRQLLRYPARLASAAGWGNILAFRHDPGAEALKAAFTAVLKVEQPTETKAEQPTVTELEPVASAVAAAPLEAKLKDLIAAERSALNSLQADIRALKGVEAPCVFEDDGVSSDV